MIYIQKRYVPGDRACIYILVWWDWRTSRSTQMKAEWSYVRHEKSQCHLEINTKLMLMAQQWQEARDCHAMKPQKIQLIF